jgi:hypothetical protein
MTTSFKLFPAQSTAAWIATFFATRILPLHRPPQNQQQLPKLSMASELRVQPLLQVESQSRCAHHATHFTSFRGIACSCLFLLYLIRIANIHFHCTF